MRKGDFFLGSQTYPLGLIIGGRNKTAAAVAQGVLKSIVVDALLRMNGASLNMSGAFLRNSIFTQPQIGTFFAGHYLLSLRQNVPKVIGSLAAFGNPLGLLRGIGDGISDFVSLPSEGFIKSIKSADPHYVVCFVRYFPPFVACVPVHKLMGVVLLPLLLVLRRHCHDQGRRLGTRHRKSC